MKPRRRPALVLLFLFLLTLPAVTPRLYASDEIQYFAFLRSLWFDRDVSFDNEYRYFDARGVAARSGFRETFLESTTPTGLRPSVATIGCALLWAPFYAVGDGTARVMRVFGSTVEVDGYSWPYLTAVCYGSAVYGWAALLLGFGMARRLGPFSPPPRAEPTPIPGPSGEVQRPGRYRKVRTALVGDSPPAVLAVWFGTPIMFYMYVAPLFAHACSAFAVALFLWTWLRVRDRWSPGSVALLGVTGALMAMVREQDVVFLIVPAIDFVRAGLRPRAQGPGPKDSYPPYLGIWALNPGPAVARAIPGVLAFALAYVPQALSYLAINGRLGPSEVTTRKMIWTSPHALDVLFSPQNGLLFWTPLVVLAIAGLVMLAAAGSQASGNDKRFIAVCLLVGLALQVYVNGAIQSWTVAGAFGQRRFVSLTAILVIGLAALFEVARRRAVARGLVACLAVLCIWWNVGLMVQFGSHRMDRQRLTLRQNAWMTFVELPRQAPAIAWQYLTNRASFYNQPRQ